MAPGTPDTADTASAPRDDSARAQLDDQLIRAARDGDRAALGRLLERYQGQVYRFGMKMCGDVEDAKEILQETLIAASRTIGGFRGDASISTWLYTIARSFCIKRRRKSRFAPTHEESLDDDRGVRGVGGGRDGDGSGRAALQIPDPAPAPDEQLASRRVEAALDRAIGALDPMYREVLVLRDVEGLTAPEAAEVIGISVDALKSRLHRARAMVRIAVEPMLVARLPAPPTLPPPGAACPDIVDLFSRHLEGELEAEIDASLCATMEQHLVGCPRCQSECDSLRRVLALCSASPAPRIPVEVQESVRRALGDLLAPSRA